MNKIRLDYFLSIGGLLVSGDKCTGVDGLEVSIEYLSIAEDWNRDEPENSQCHITSFTERAYKGVQPVPDGFPVEWISVSGGKRKTTNLHWDSNVVSWKPDYEKLLEMQKEHDAKQEKPIEELMINAKESKMSNVYTQEMKDAGHEIELGMLYLDGEGNECKLVGEDNFGDCYIGRPTNSNLHERYLSLSVKDRCSPIKTKEELEIEEAKDKQVDKIKEEVGHYYGEYDVEGFLLLMQERGLLPELVLPSEGK